VYNVQRTILKTRRYILCIELIYAIQQKRCCLKLVVTCNIMTFINRASSQSMIHVYMCFVHVFTICQSRIKIKSAKSCLKIIVPSSPKVFSGSFWSSGLSAAIKRKCTVLEQYLYVPLVFRQWMIKKSFYFTTWKESTEWKDKSTFKDVLIITHWH